MKRFTKYSIAHTYNKSSLMVKSVSYYTDRHSSNSLPSPPAIPKNHRISSLLHIKKEYQKRKKKMLA